jgi:hypothetical protein
VTLAWTRNRASAPATSPSKLVGAIGVSETAQDGGAAAPPPAPEAELPPDPKEAPPVLAPEGGPAVLPPLPEAIPEFELPGEPAVGPPALLAPPDPDVVLPPVVVPLPLPLGDELPLSDVPTDAEQDAAAIASTSARP